MPAFLGLGEILAELDMHKTLYTEGPKNDSDGEQSLN